MITASQNVSGLTALMDQRALILDDLSRHAQETMGQVGGVLAETSQYVLASPGKLLRPLLMLDACRAAGGDPALALPAAAGTEYGHIASLIHDDIIDGDGERRGQTTLHVKYDLATAILTGDLFIFQTFLSYTQCYHRGVSAERVLAAIETLSQTCIDVCRGQALEAGIVGRLDVHEQTYVEMIRLKTAAVCRASTRIGALLSGASDNVIDALSRYGDNLGTAFQIIDDVLAYDGRPSIVGKPLYSDLANKRVTLPIIYALQSESPAVEARIRELFASDHHDTADDHDSLVELLNSTRALERARALAYHYTAQAKQQLALLPPSDARDRLHTMADILVARDH